MTIPPDKFEAIREFYDSEYYAGHLGSTRLPWHCRKVGARLGKMADS